MNKKRALVCGVAIAIVSLFLLDAHISKSTASQRTINLQDSESWSFSRKLRSLLNHVSKTPARLVEGDEFERLATEAQHASIVFYNRVPKCGSATIAKRFKRFGERERFGRQYNSKRSRIYHNEILNTTRQVSAPVYTYYTYIKQESLGIELPPPPSNKQRLRPLFSWGNYVFPSPLVNHMLPLHVSIISSFSGATCQTNILL